MHTHVHTRPRLYTKTHIRALVRRKHGCFYVTVIDCGLCGALVSVRAVHCVRLDCRVAQQHNPTASSEINQQMETVLRHRGRTDYHLLKGIPPHVDPRSGHGATNLYTVVLLTISDDAIPLPLW